MNVAGLTKTQRNALWALRSGKPAMCRYAAKSSRTMTELAKRGLVKRRDFETPRGGWSHEWIAIDPKTGGKFK